MKRNNWDKRELNKLYHVDGKTLAEIGTLYNVCRERIRQVMRDFNLPPGHNQSQRIQSQKGKYGNRYSSLEDYLASYPGKKDWSVALNKYADKSFCSECGRSKKTTILHIHHITYPATSLDDIQILCASCHYTKHKKGITFAKQLDIYNLYCNGMRVIDLATKYNVSPILIYKIINKIKNGKSTLRG